MCVCVNVCVYAHMRMTWCLYGGQRTACGIIVWVLGIDLRSSGLEESAFTF